MTSLLALHGFTGSPQSWDFLAPSSRGTALVPALIGHVGAAPSDIRDFDAEVTRLAALAVPAGRVHVAGYSLGARLALGIAARYPDLVSRLTLISGHPGLGSELERANRRASDAGWIELLRTRGLRAFVQAWESLPMWASQASLPAEAREQKRRERLSHDALGLIASLRSTGLAEMPDYTPELARLRVPVTLLAGALDLKFVALARHMAERLPRAELQIAPGAGHDLLLERPEFVARLISRAATEHEYRS